MAESFYLDTSGVFRARALDRFDWLEHGFGTRESSAWPESTRLAALKQVHSATVIAAGRAGMLGEGDALIANRPGLLIGIRTADCVPVLLVDPEKRAVAAVHAGWRGTAQNIVARAILDMQARFGTQSRDLYAAIGPAIGKCCYEVGPGVAREFVSWWPQFDGIGSPVLLDLPATNRRQLADAGVRAENISIGAPCTLCTSALHSYRRDGKAAGRMMSAIGIRGWGSTLALMHEEREG